MFEQTAIYDLSRPLTAYEIEGQPIAITELQQNGKLHPRKVRFTRFDSCMELGIEWYRLYCRGSFGQLVLFGGECNLELMERLKIGQSLTVVGNKTVRPELVFGRNESLVAAIFVSRGRILYQSLGFDLEQWRQEKSAKL